MKASESETLVFANRHVESVIALIILTVAVTAILLIKADNVIAGDSVFLTIPLIGILTLLSFQRQSKSRDFTGFTVVLSLFSLTVVLPFMFKAQLSAWIYLIPALLINFMSFRVNAIVITCYSALIAYMLQHTPESTGALPTLMSFIFVAILCLFMAYLKDQMLLRLEALDINHPETGWYLRRGLKQSLQREIQRAEREGSGLSFSMIDLQSHQESMQWRDIKSMIERAIRPFDQVFHYSKNKITIIHPYATSNEIQQKLEEEVKRHPNETFRAGIASLNISDTATDILGKTRAALLCSSPEKPVATHEA